LYGKAKEIYEFNGISLKDDNFSLINKKSEQLSHIFDPDNYLVLQCLKNPNREVTIFDGYSSDVPIAKFCMDEFSVKSYDEYINDFNANKKVNFYVNNKEHSHTYEMYTFFKYGPKYEPSETNIIDNEYLSKLYSIFNNIDSNDDGIRYINEMKEINNKVEPYDPTWKKAELVNGFIETMKKCPFENIEEFCTVNRSIFPIYVIEKMFKDCQKNRDCIVKVFIFASFIFSVKKYSLFLCRNISSLSENELLELYDKSSELNKDVMNFLSLCDKNVYNLLNNNDEKDEAIMNDKNIN
jgi:hypothetical protein